MGRYEELVDSLPTDTVECRKRAELLARHRPVTEAGIQEAIAWALLAIAGELHEANRIERRRQ